MNARAIAWLLCEVPIVLVYLQVSGAHMQYNPEDTDTRDQTGEIFQACLQLC